MYPRKLTERLMANPSPMHKPVNTIKTTGSGLIYFDTFRSHHMEGFRTVVDSSPADEIAGIPMASSGVNLLLDQFLLKNRGHYLRQYGTAMPPIGQSLGTKYQGYGWHSTK